ncbi:MAG: hypothetical protein RI953_2384 [Pseudomonadota bacterium]
MDAPFHLFPQGKTQAFAILKIEERSCGFEAMI